MTDREVGNVAEIKHLFVLIDGFHLLDWSVVKTLTLDTLFRTLVPTNACIRYAPQNGKSSVVISALWHSYPQKMQ